jgi:hypothetical protein
MRVWIVLQLVLALIAMAILLLDWGSSSALPRHLNTTATWQGWLKIIAYFGFGAALLVPGVVLDFCASKRGETIPSAATEAVPAIATPGEPANLTAVHTSGLLRLSNAMKIASGALIVVGAFDVLSGLMTMGKTPGAAALNLLDGLPWIGLGLILAAPLQALQPLLTQGTRTMDQVMTFLSRLSATFAVYIILLVALGVVIVWRLSM